MTVNELIAALQAISAAGHGGMDTTAEYCRLIPEQHIDAKTQPFGHGVVISPAHTEGGFVDLGNHD